MEVIVRVISMTFHYIERLEIIAPTRLTLEALETIARPGANVRYLYLILNNACRDPGACNTPKDRVRRETRRLVSYCKYAKHRAASEPKIALFYQNVFVMNVFGETSQLLNVEKRRGRHLYLFLPSVPAAYLYVRFLPRVSQKFYATLRDRQNLENSI